MMATHEGTCAWEMRVDENITHIREGIARLETRMDAVTANSSRCDVHGQRLSAIEGRQANQARTWKILGGIATVLIPVFTLFLTRLIFG